MNHPFRKLILASSIALTMAGIGVSVAAEPKPKPTVSEEINDARREAQIWTSFATNPHLHAFDLKVEVKGNKAILDGKVQSSVEKDLAEQIALGAEDIRHIDNRLVVDSNYEPPKRAASERSFGEKVEDATITASVKSKLLWNSHTDGLVIHVDTNNGQVTLTGTAATSEEKDLAGRIAGNTNNVVGVNNQIAVTGKPSTTEKAKGEVKTTAKETQDAVSDGWITTKVKSSLLWTRNVNGFDITVTTSNGLVLLTGDVDSQAMKERAIAVAQDIRGVKKVDASQIKVR